MASKDRERTETRGVEHPEGHSESDISRRSFLGGTAAVIAAGAVMAPGIGSCTGAAPGSGNGRQEEGVPTTNISVNVNGNDHQIQVEDRWTLNEMLRDGLGLKGSKLGCNKGECGACSVLLDGDVVYSCSTLAVWADGRSVVTIEGLERGGEPSRVQRAFMDWNGAQCGFCTPGQVIAATALLERDPSPSRAEIRRALSGNLCRCSNYNAIVEAVEAATGAGGGAGGTA